LRRTRQRAQLATGYQRLADAVDSLRHFQILPFTEPAMDRYDQLHALRLNVRTKDLQIAATALEFGATLVTRNLRDFQRVPNLPLADWSR
jgi:tRNA(fMet)-specific endonuclease VapC